MTRARRRDADDDEDFVPDDFVDDDEDDDFEIDDDDQSGSDVGENEADSDDDEHEADAPEQRVFASWEDCLQFMDRYFDRTWQPMRIRTSVSVATHNKDTLAKKAKRDAARSQHHPARTRGVVLIPESWGRYNRMWVCTHVGEYVSRGEGKRKRRRSRAAACLASFSACVRAGRTGGFHVALTKMQLRHSHPLSAQRYKSYPRNRLLLSDQVMHEISILHRRGAPTEEIHRHVVETTPSQPRRYDIRNLVWRMRQSTNSSSSFASRIQSWVDTFVSRPGHIGRVFFDEDKVATAIVFQTLHMRRMLARFESIVMIDATHDTNAEGYKLFSFMVVDSFGQSQFAQHAFIKNERMETISTVVDAFISSNPAAARIKCFMVDKHFTEIAVLRSMFPEASVLLCQFHAVKYLRDVVLKYDLSPQQHSSLQDAMGLIVYAPSEVDYNKILAYVKRVVEPQHQHEFNEGIVAGDVNSDVNTSTDLLTSSDTSGFYEYFIRNWHQCREMWCSFERDNMETIGVNTNNRLEATWRHVKTLIRASDHLDATLSHVEHYQQTLETEYNLNANPISRAIDEDYDEVMLDFASLVTDYAVQLVLPEYKFATRAVYHFDDDGAQIHIQSTTEVGGVRRVYHILKEIWSCSCSFMATTRLPCRHVIHVRSKKGYESVFPPARLLSKRWLLRYAANMVDSSEDIPQLPQFDVREALPRYGGRTLTRNEKYACAKEVADRICGAAASLSMPRFKRVMTALERIRDVIARDDVDALLAFLDGVPADCSDETPDAPAVQDESVMDGHIQDIQVDIEEDIRGNIHGDNIQVSSPQDAAAERELSCDLGGGDVDPDRDGNENDAQERCDQDDQDDGTGPISTVAVTDEDGAMDVEDVDDGDGRDVGDIDKDDDSDGFTDADCEPTFRIVERPRSSKTTEKRKKRAERYSATRHAVDLHDDGVSFASFYFAENEPGITMGKLVEVTLALRVHPDPIRAKVKALRVPPKGTKVISNFQIFYVLPLNILNEAKAAIVRFQSANPGVAEKDILVQIPGNGVYFSSTVNCMRRWHGAVKLAHKHRGAFKWFCEVSGFDVEDEWLIVPDPSSAQARIDAMEVSRMNLDVYDLIGTAHLSDSAIEAVFGGLFDGDPVAVSVAYIEEKHERRQKNRLELRVGNLRLEERDALANVDVIKEWMHDSSDMRWLRLPTFFSRVKHWVCICIDMEKRVVVYYDPSAQKKMELEIIVKLDISRLLHGSFRTRYAQPFMQLDNYNCGVFVLMFAEHVVHNRDFPDVDRNLLQYLRYRYFCLGL